MTRSKSSTAAKPHRKIVVVDDDVVVPIRVGKRTYLISHQSITERMRDDFDERHGTGRDFDDDDDYQA